MSSSPYEALLLACQQMQRNREVFAKPTIERHILTHVDEHTPNDELTAHLVAEALMSRLDRSLVARKNIYIAQFDIPQIDLFYEMATAYPHIYLSHHIANRALADEMAPLRSVTLLEIGIGKGTQVEHLFDRLARHPKLALNRVNVVAIDPDPANLRDSEVRLSTVARRMPFMVDFLPILGLLEGLPPETLSGISDTTGGRLVMNAAYTLHHIIPRRGDEQYRTEVLGRLAELRPRLVTLVEPNSDHHTPHLATRFHNCWTHFTAVFDLIDEAPLEPAVRFSIKEKFFGREIRDMFGVSDLFRCERHERTDQWIERFHRAGFVPDDVHPTVEDVPARCETQTANGMVRLQYRSNTLISVMVQRPRRDRERKR